MMTIRRQLHRRWLGPVLGLCLAVAGGPSAYAQGFPPGSDDTSSEAKDSDGDGILDSVDRCPGAAGTLDNKGCPTPDELGTAPTSASAAPADDSTRDDDDDGGGFSDGAAVMATIGGVTLGIGGVSLLVAGALWIASCSTRNSVHLAREDDRGIITGITQREARDQLELADDLETSAGVTAAVGAGLMATGLVLAIVAGGFAAADASSSNDPDDALTIAPSVTPDGGGVSLRVRF